MVFVSPDGALGCISLVDVWRNTLVVHIIFGECICNIVGAFIVEDVKIWGFAVLSKGVEHIEPSVTDTCSSPVDNCPGMDRVGVIVVEDEKIFGSARRCDWELTRLVGVGFRYLWHTNNGA